MVVNAMQEVWILSNVVLEKYVFKIHALEQI